MAIDEMLIIMIIGADHKLLGQKSNTNSSFRHTLQKIQFLSEKLPNFYIIEIAIFEIVQ